MAAEIVCDSLVEDAAHIGFADERSGLGTVAESEVVEHLGYGGVGNPGVEIRAREICLQRRVASVFGNVALHDPDREVGHPACLGDPRKRSVHELVARVVRSSLVQLVPRVAGTDPGDLVCGRRKRGIDAAHTARGPGLCPVHYRGCCRHFLGVLLDQSVRVVHVQNVTPADEHGCAQHRQERP